MPLFFHFLRRHRHVLDELRLPAQTAIAVILAYLAALGVGLQEVTWAVFSALFVVQASVGGTIGSAFDRMLGGLFGAALGVGVVALFGNDGWHVLAALATGVLLMSLIALRWPGLSYGLVTVAVLAVTPGPYFIEGALEKTLAIALGSCCGLLAGVAVFPVSAWRSADRQLSSAVRGLGRLLDACSGGMMGREAVDRAAIHDAIQRALQTGRDMALSSRLEKSAHSVDRRLADTVLHGLERFWYSLAMLDRLSTEPLSERVQRHLRQGVDELASATGRHIDGLADAIENCRAAPSADEVCAAYDAFVRALDTLQRDPGLTDSEREHAIALKWAWSLVVRHAREMTADIDRVLE